MSLRFSGAILLGILLSGTASAEATPPTWRDSTRDVHINGALDRPAQVLSIDKPRRLAIFSNRLRDVLVMDLDAKRSYTVPKKAWKFSEDQMTAVAQFDSVRAGHEVWSTPDNIHFARAGRHRVVVKPHQSTAGPIAESSLLDGFPSWAAAARAYQPVNEAVAALSRVNEPTTMKVVFATWCGDSRYAVPRVLKAVRAAANPNLKVELIGIGPDFHSPLGFIEENRIINVPTVIVEREGTELGRIVETAASASLEEDLAAIAEGKTLEHKGRWERAAAIARGTYRIDSAKAPRTEQWEMFATPSGGRLVHSIISGAQVPTREIWHTFDANGKTTFVEITETSERTTRRTRYRIGGSTLRAHSRGNTSGIVDQIVELPESCAFDSGSIAAAAWHDGAGEETRLLDCYRAGDCDIAGVVNQLAIRSAGRENVKQGSIDITADRITVTHGRQEETVWTHPSLGIPLRIAGEDRKVELIELIVA